MDQKVNIGPRSTTNLVKKGIILAFPVLLDFVVDEVKTELMPRVRIELTIFRL